MFEKDLTRNLFQFQNTIVKHLFKKKNQYNKLLNNFRMKSRDNGVDILNDLLNFDGVGVFGTIRNYSGISYALGKSMAYSEFKLDEKPELDHFEKIETVGESQKLSNKIKIIYYDTVKELILDSIILNSNFPMFMNEINGAFNQNKKARKAQTRSIYLPDFPIIKQIVNNVKIAHTTSSFVKGMVNTYKSTGHVKKMQYLTQEDEKVSSRCRKWHGTTLPIDKIDGIIPQHLNCRCRWIPDT